MAYDDSEVFKLCPFKYDDDAVGFIDGPNPVVLITNRAKNEGLCMSQDDALKYSEALRCAAMKGGPNA